MFENRCVWLGVLPGGTKAPRDDITLWRYWIDMVLNVPKCLIPGWCCADLTEVFGTDIDVVPTPAQAPVHTYYQYRRYRY